MKISAELTVFDGAGCIGGNKIYLKSGDTGVFLDFGMNFGTMGSYYEEFLKPRISGKGLNDLIKMGITPALSNIYREDGFLEGERIEGPSIDAAAVFISHAHADHVGHLGLLKNSIPVYCSEVSAALIKATQDSGSPSIDGENVIYSDRHQNPKTDEALLAKINSYSYCWRDYRNVYEAPAKSAFNTYWRENLVSERNKASKKYECAPRDFGSGGDRVGDISFKAMPVDHSVYGATAYIFETAGKTICYSGDFRMHGLRGQSSRDFMEYLAEINPDFLIVEGTNVGSLKGNDIGDAQRASEHDVYENCLEAVKVFNGRLVIADFGPRNIERLIIFLRIAEETGRRLAVTSKDLLFLQAMGTADADIMRTLASPSLTVYLPPKVSNKAWEVYAMDACGCPAVTAEDIKEAPGRYIASFSFWDMNNLVDIEPDGGAYIYSTCEAFNEEMQIDVLRLANWLDHFGLTPIGFSVVTEPKTGVRKAEFVKGYHASGHVSSRELKEFLEKVKPGVVIPIHTEHPEEFKHLISGDTKLIIPEKARPITL